jgi:hypothetical protein
MSLPNNNKNYTAISIKDSSISYPPSSKLFCNVCSSNIICIDSQKGEWYCNRCSISYFPNKGEKVIGANKFVTPGPTTDANGNITGERRPIFAMVKDTPSLSPKKPNFPRCLEMLKRPGVNILDFSSTVDGEGI